LQAQSNSSKPFIENRVSFIGIHMSIFSFASVYYFNIRTYVSKRTRERERQKKNKIDC